MIENIKRGLGIITQLDWVTTPKKEKDTSSSIDASYPIITSDQICELFHQDNVDKIHREKAQSKKITIKELEGFEKIVIENKSHIDVEIIVEETSNHAQLYIEVQDQSNKDCITTGITVVAQNNTNFQLAINLKNKPETLHVCKEVCISQDNARVLWFTHTNGTKQVIISQKALLQGKHSCINTISTLSAQKNDKFDITTISQHSGEHTHSNIIFKSVLASAQVIAQGLVQIEPTAKHSQGYQSSKILLLDTHARAITIPDLEIENKDVMCSHGSTISSINEEKLFYLQSRGLTLEQSKELIIKGFIDELYEQLEGELKDELQHKEEL